MSTNLNPERRGTDWTWSEVTPAADGEPILVGVTDLRWQAMTDEEREAAYSPSSVLPDGDYRPFVAAYGVRSDTAWAALDATDATVSTVAYGPSASQTIDIVVPAAVPVTGPPPPLLVFIHGGYWQELSKTDSRFAALDCINHGWAFAAVDYTLAPAADIPTIVDECRQAVNTLVTEAERLGYDPARIVVAGSSAGAHLAAMVGLVARVKTPAISGTVLVSGIFALEPLIGTSINDALDLDTHTAISSSPLLADLDSFPPSVVAYGDNETEEFKAQSAAFAARLSAAGTTTVPVEIPDRNHFDVILELATPGTMLGDAVAELIAETGEHDADL